MKGVSAGLRVVVAVEESLLRDLGGGEEGGVGAHHVHLVGGEHVDLAVPRNSSHVEDKVAAVRRSEEVSRVYTSFHATKYSSQVQRISTSTGRSIWLSTGFG